MSYLAYLYNERREPTSRTFGRINDAIMWLHAQLPTGTSVDVRPSEDFIYEIEGDEEGYTIRGYVAADDELDAELEKGEADE